MLNQDYLNENNTDAVEFDIMLNQREKSEWKSILPFERLNPYTYHRYSEFENSGPFTFTLYALSKWWYSWVKGICGLNLEPRPVNKVKNRIGPKISLVHDYVILDGY